MSGSTINGTAGDDVVSTLGVTGGVTGGPATAGNDVITGRQGNDTLAAGGGNDQLFGGNGSDILDGEAGNDTLDGGRGADVLEGGAGRDRASYAGTLDDAGVAPSLGAFVNLGGVTVISGTVTLAAGTARDQWGNVDTLSGIEDAVGTTRPDRFWGDGGANTFFGNGGNDSFYGGAGDDRFEAGPTAFATVYYSYSGVPEPATGVQVNLSGGVVAGIAARTGLDGFGGTDTFSGGITNAVGTSLGDVLVGTGSTSNYSYVNGWRGADDLWAVSANDFTVASYSGHVAGVSVDLALNRATDGWGDTDTLHGIRHVLGSSFNDVMSAGSVTGNFVGSLGDDSYAADGTERRVVDYRGNTASLPGGIAVAYSTMTAATVVKDGAGTDTLSFITDVLGTAFDDSYVAPATGTSIWTLRFRPGAGNDTINTNGNGRVAVDYTDAATGIVADLATGVVQDGLSGTDQLTNVVRLRLSSFNDIVTGSARNETFELVNNLGSKSLVGGGGFDTYRFQGGFKLVLDFANGSAERFDSSGVRTATDTISGMEAVAGGDGDDTFAGSAANEQFFGGRGVDTMDGGGGTDLLITDDFTAGAPAPAQGVRVNLSGVQQVVAGVTLAANTAVDSWGTADRVVNIENANGTAFADLLVGTDAPGAFSSLAGGRGADVLQAAASSTVARYENDPGAVAVNLGTGSATDGWGDTDTLVLIRHALGSAFNDTLLGDGQSNWLRGGRGDDVVAGGEGGDTLEGGDGNDALLGGTAVDTLLGGDGNDQLDGGSGADEMLGGLGDDLYAIRDAGQHGFEAGGSDSALVFTDDWQAFDGLEVIALQGTATRVLGGGTGEVIYANATLSSNIAAGAGDDVLLGSTAADVLMGGAGNDQVLGNGGADIIYGGTGDDVVLVVHAATVYDETFDAGGTDLAVVDTAANWSFGPGIEYVLLTGAGRAATATGGTGVAMANFGANASTLTGGAGNDSIYGGALSDTLSGGGGNDSLLGRGGGDTLDGGTGDDLYLISDAADVVVEGALPGDGTDTAFVEANGWTVSAHVEIAQLIGTATRLSAGSGTQVLYANGGAASTLDGGAGDDTLLSTALGDTLVGGAGDDVYAANGGADVIWLNAPNFGTDNAFFLDGALFRVSFVGSGVTSAAQVTVNDLGAAVQLVTAQGTINLFGVTVQQATDAMLFA
ncbi:beta strand repeat-containing protein [Roseococcus sp. DSY-14]|uniref:beta strand repeat-containing protein n=1 Tax=Roseococcus sp. DSY-14 TaxID=3369650 RepID=UPI00387B414A